MGLLFAPVRWALRLIFTLGFGIAVYLVVSGVQIALAEASTSAPTPPASTALVVWAAPARGGGLSTDDVARLTQVRRLYHAHVASRVLVVGPSSGQVLRDALSWLSQHGLAAASVATLPARNLGAGLSSSSAGFARGSSITIVADAIDSFLDRADASSAGLRSTISAVPGSSHAATSEIGSLFNQASALALSRVIGVSRVPWGGG